MTTKPKPTTETSEPLSDQELEDVTGGAAHVQTTTKKHAPASQPKEGGWYDERSESDRGLSR